MGSYSADKFIMDVLEIELKGGFLVEADQLLKETKQLFLSLQKTNGDEASLNSMFRMAHNLKGASQAVGFTEIAEFIHRFENVILKLKNKELILDNQVVGILLACIDKVRIMVDGLAQDLSATFDTAELTLKLLDLSGSGTAELRRSPVLLSSGQTDPYQPSEKIFESPKMGESEVIESQKAIDLFELKVNETVTVSAERLDKLSSLVGELVLLESKIGNLRSTGRDADFESSISQLKSLAKDIHDLTAGLRIHPYKPT